MSDSPVTHAMRNIPPIERPEITFRGAVRIPPGHTTAKASGWRRDKSLPLALITGRPPSVEIDGDLFSADDLRTIADLLDEYGDTMNEAVRVGVAAAGTVVQEAMRADA